MEQGTLSGHVIFPGEAKPSFLKRWYRASSLLLTASDSAIKQSQLSLKTAAERERGRRERRKERGREGKEA